MRLLLDTHLVLWVAGESERLPSVARALIEAPENEIYFSVVSIWELAIKSRLYEARPRQDDLQVNPELFRRLLLANNYQEVTVNGNHAEAIATLPPIHKDPFDRMLVAQAQVEGLTLLTADPQVARYQVPYHRHIQKV